MPARESGGRGRRQPGQILTEAATTISPRVVPAPTCRRFAAHASTAPARTG